MCDGIAFSVVLHSSLFLLVFLKLCFYPCVCPYARMYVHIQTNMYALACVYLFVCAHLCVCLYVCIFSPLNAFVFSLVCVCYYVCRQCSRDVKIDSYEDAGICEIISMYIINKLTTIFNRKLYIYRGLLIIVRYQYINI